jgi:indole-3-glycerol phosphate synthase
VPLPVLRKDFIIDPWQLWQSRAAGADAVLLIAECLTISEMVDLMILSQQLGMTALVEVHSMENLLRVRPHVGFPHPTYQLLGINNRDLAAQKTDLNHTLRLVDLVDDPSILVSESGIKSSKDLANLRQQRVRIVLVGESLMKADDPGAALARLLDRPVR